MIWMENNALIVSLIYLYDLTNIMIHFWKFMFLHQSVIPIYSYLKLCSVVISML